MQIMCLNGWGGTLHAELLPFLRDAAPDVLCLQEVVHSPASAKAELTYRDGAHVLPQRANLFSEVCAALPDHVATFCPAAQGVLWDGDVPVLSQWGLATFVHRSLSVIGQVQGFVHKDFGADGYGDHPRSRSAHGVRVHDFAAGRSLSVVHMHGLRDLDGKGDTPARAAQARRLAGMARDLAQDGEGLVVCGDFNVLPGSETFEILAEIGLTDLVQAAGPDGTRTSHYKKSAKFADYMLVNAAVRQTRFEILRVPEVSDHCPLVLTV